LRGLGFVTTRDRLDPDDPLVGARIASDKLDYRK